MSNPIHSTDLNEESILNTFKELGLIDQDERTRFINMAGYKKNDEESEFKFVITDNAVDIEVAENQNNAKLESVVG